MTDLATLSERARRIAAARRMSDTARAAALAEIEGQIAKLIADETCLYGFERTMALVWARSEDEARELAWREMNAPNPLSSSTECNRPVKWELGHVTKYWTPAAASPATIVAREIAFWTREVERTERYLAYAKDRLKNLN